MPSPNPTSKSLESNMIQARVCGGPSELRGRILTVVNAQKPPWALAKKEQEKAGV